MAIRFDCPHCKETLEAQDELAGKKAKCPKCDAEVMVPEKQE